MEVAYPWGPKTQEGSMLALDCGTFDRLAACKKSEVIYGYRRLWSLMEWFVRLYLVILIGAFGGIGF